jgi:hypothetical protein
MKLSLLNEFYEPFGQANLENKNALFKDLGISPERFEVLGTGSHATAYDVGDGKVLKVTSDVKDANNLLRAQNLNDPGVVKAYGSSKVGVSDGVAILVDKVEGELMPYSTGELHALIQGTNFQELPMARITILRDNTGIRKKILDKHGRNHKEERKKLSSLFTTLIKLEKIGIDFDDFAENVIDTDTRYVVIDLGN